MYPTNDGMRCYVQASPGACMEAGKVEGWVHSTETFGASDGPGIRYILFLSGCPLHCIYCHNPDTWHQRDGKLMTAREVLSDIGDYREFISEHGGVTLSGGEPLVQPEFCAAFLRGCKEMGLHTALDTSGYLGNLADDEMLGNVDLVLLDIKAFRESVYQRITDVRLAPTAVFAERLADLGKPIWLRYVLVPGFTDNLDDIAGLATYAAGLGNVERVDVLPFHKLGEHKWRARRLHYGLESVAPPSEERIGEAREIFRTAGFFVT